MLDANEREISFGVHVKVPGHKTPAAVVGMSECCNEDIVILGSVSNGDLVKPWCERADHVRVIV